MTRLRSDDLVAVIAAGHARERDATTSADVTVCNRRRGGWMPQPLTETVHGARVTVAGEKSRSDCLQQ